MLWILTLLAGSAAAPPPPGDLLLHLHESHDAGVALAAADRLLEVSGDRARRLGVDYARARALEELGRLEEAGRAYVAALAAVPELQPWTRLRLAELEMRRRHPEVAAGLLATLLGDDPPAELVASASERLVEAMAAGGDCRLLAGLSLPAPHREAQRRIELARGDCEVRGGAREAARDRWLAVVREEGRDEVARQAAERLSRLPASILSPRQVAETGVVLLHHRRLEQTLRLSATAEGAPATPEALLLRARVHLSREELPAAVAAFGTAAASAQRGRLRAQALYQQGQALAMAGRTDEARRSFVRSANQSPPSEWTGGALLQIARLDWRAGRTEAAREVIQTLAGRRSWSAYTARAALFVAASELARGQAADSTAWLDLAARHGAPAREVTYWRAREDELRGRTGAAVQRYADLLLQDPHGLLAEAARQRLASPQLAGAAVAAARQRASRGQIAGYASAWHLLPPDHRDRATVGRRLLAAARVDPDLAGFVDLAPLEPAAWTIWRRTRPGPTAMLLALGRWEEVELATIIDYFPPSQPALALAAAERLAAAGALARSVTLADLLRQRLRGRLPLPLLPPRLAQVLFPTPWPEEATVAAGEARLDPRLLWALIREDSRFEPGGTPTTGGSGLSRLTPAVAREVAERLGLGPLDRADLAAPAPALRVAASHFAALQRRFDGELVAALAAHHTGVADATLWRRLCFTDDPAEYYTKIGRRATRAYVDRVTTAYEGYRVAWAAAPGAAAPQGRLAATVP